MATPSPVNDQITNSVTQINTKVTGDSPAEAMGELYQNDNASVPEAGKSTDGRQQADTENA